MKLNAIRLTKNLDKLVQYQETPLISADLSPCSFQQYWLGQRWIWTLTIRAAVTVHQRPLTPPLQLSTVAERSDSLGQMWYWHVYYPHCMLPYTPHGEPTGGRQCHTITWSLLIDRLRRNCVYTQSNTHIHTDNLSLTSKWQTTWALFSQCAKPFIRSNVILKYTMQ